MKTCLINTGNTNTEFCNIFLKNYTKMPTADFCKASRDLLKDYSDCCIASVVPEALASIKSQNSSLSFHCLSVQKIKNIDFSQVDPSTLGADRLANIAAAQSLLGESTLVIDCGTCITAELTIENIFKGGFIMPGRNLQRKAVADYTGQLPAVTLSDELMTIGKDTKSSLKVGIDTLSVIGVQTWAHGLIKNHPNLKVCFTGGDYNIYSLNAPFDFTVYEDLTLQGLKIFAESLKSDK